MMHLPRRDLILSQRISKGFKDVYDRSQNVKNRLPMPLPAYGETIYHWTRRIGPFPMVRASSKYDYKLKIEIFGYEEALNRNDEASWRSIPLVLPTGTTLLGSTIDRTGRGMPMTSKIGQVQRKLRGTISLGEFADVLRDHICSENKDGGHVQLVWAWSEEEAMEG